MQKPDLATRTWDTDSLLKNSDVVIEIMPTRIEPGNPYVNYVVFEVTSIFKGDFSSEAMFLPSTLEVNHKYVIFLKGDEQEGYDLTAREGVFPQGTAEYENFLSTWENK